MASIVQIKGKWRALVRRKGHPSYCKTFAAKAQAVAWARQIEAEIDRGQAPAARAVIGGNLLVSQVIEEYRKMRGRTRPILDTSNEHYMLRALDRELGKLGALTLNPQNLVSYCEDRAEQGAGPYTRNMEISKLGTVYRYVGVSLKVDLPDVVRAARPLLSHLQLIGGGGHRERRVTEDEIVRIIERMASDFGQVYADAVRFAVLTAMRRGEICELRWSDVDRAGRMALVRNRKDPRNKAGNDQWVPLLGDALAIIDAQPRVDGQETVFRMHPQTLSKYFKRVCDAEGIPDVHFHDLRHEGTSRLFEQGFAVQEVALVTGHKDWKHLRRYTNLRPQDLHDGPAARRAGRRGSGDDA